jgi:hypothetical protein
MGSWIADASQRQLTCESVKGQVGEVCTLRTVMVRESQKSRGPPKAALSAVCQRSRQWEGCTAADSSERWWADGWDKARCG